MRMLNACMLQVLALSASLEPSATSSLHRCSKVSVKEISDMKSVVLTCKATWIKTCATGFNTWIQDMKIFEPTGTSVLRSQPPTHAAHMAVRWQTANIRFAQEASDAFPHGSAMANCYHRIRSEAHQALRSSWFSDALFGRP